MTTVVLDAAVAQTLLRYVIAPFAAGVVAFVVWFRRNPDVTPTMDAPRNPLQIGPAFQVVLFAVTWVRQAFGNPGLLVSGAVLGLTDVDALTISMARSGAQGVSPGVAAQAIAIGVMANCALKLALSLAFGTSRYRCQRPHVGRPGSGDGGHARRPSLTRTPAPRSWPRAGGCHEVRLGP